MICDDRTTVTILVMSKKLLQLQQLPAMLSSEVLMALLMVKCGLSAI